MQKESETKVKSPKPPRKNKIVTEQTAKDLFDINVTAKSLSKKKAEKKPKKEKNIQKLAMQFIEDPTEKNFELLFERIIVLRKFLDESSCRRHNHLILTITINNVVPPHSRFLECHSDTRLER